MPIHAYACTRGLQASTITQFFKWMGWSTPSSRDGKLAAILEGFGDEWNFTLEERGYCFMQCHQLTAKILNDAKRYAKNRVENPDMDTLSSDLICVEASDEEGGGRGSLLIGPLADYKILALPGAASQTHLLNSNPLSQNC